MPNVCQMPQVKGEDASSLRQLINHVSSHMNALQALSLNVPIKDLVLNHLITLDPETQWEWEIFTASCADTPTTAELVTFLETRGKAFELLQNVVIKYVYCSSRVHTSAVAKVSKPIYCNVATQIQCRLCNESHRLFKCGRFLKLQAKQRANRAKQLGLRFNCLQPFFKGNARSRQMCRQHNKRHHTLLHIDTENQTAYDKGSTSNKNLSAGTKGSTAAEFTTYWSLKSKPRNHILATAIV